MPDYNFNVRVLQTRCYSVMARNAEEAEELLREEYTMMEYDIADEEIDEVEEEP